MKAIFLVLFCAALVSADTVYYSSHEENTETVLDFLKGFFDGVNQKGILDNTVKCILGSKPLIEEYVKIWELIKNFDISKINQLISLVIETVKKTVTYVYGCEGAINEIKSIITKILSINFINLLYKIFTDINTIIKIITEIFNTKDHYELGKVIGSLLYKLLLEGELSSLGFNFTDFIVLIEGFFEGAIGGKLIEDFTKCLESLDTVYHLVLSAIEKFRHIDIKNIRKLIEGLVELFRAMEKVLNATIPCSSTPELFQKMIHKIANTTITVILERFTKNSPTIIVTIVGMSSQILNKEWRALGRSIGSIMKILIFVDIKSPFE